MKLCAFTVSDRVSGVLEKLGMTEDMSIEHPFISRAIENAQTRVEGHNFEIRKISPRIRQCHEQAARKPSTA